MTVAITALYAAILGIILIAIGMRVSILRGQTGISILHGDNMQLAERMRVHGNFSEHVPMALILMGLAEGIGASAMVLHGTGLALVVGRLLHAAGIDHERPAAPARIAGSSLTSLAMLACIGAIAWHAASGNA